MSKRLPGRLWGKFRVGGAEWQERFVQQDILDKLAGKSAEALTVPEYNTIFYSAELIPVAERLRVTVFHERLHACGSSPGAVHVLCGLLKCSDEDLGDIEENIATYYAPMLAEAFAGVWKMPKVPR